MHFFKILLLSSLFFLVNYLYCNTSILFCGREYNAKKVNVYLKDEGLEATMMQISDKNTNKFVFGYFVSAIRKDTNFISGLITHSGDTIIRKTYRRYKITAGVDSVISKFICKPAGILFYSSKTFWNGKVIENDYHNRMLGE